MSGPSSVLPQLITGAVTVTLPTGAATESKQDTGNSSLASIDTKTPALGQALAASSQPVVLTALQLSALTPPAAIVGFALEAGNLASILAKIISAPATEAKQDTGNTSLASIDTSTARLPVAQGTLNATTIYGPLSQAIVSDSPESYTPGYVQPLSMTSEGRMRVSAVIADIDRAWQHTFDNPWPAGTAAWSGNPYE